MQRLVRSDNSNLAQGGASDGRPPSPQGSTQEATSQRLGEKTGQEDDKNSEQDEHTVVASDEPNMNTNPTAIQESPLPQMEQLQVQPSEQSPSSTERALGTDVSRGQKPTKLDTHRLKKKTRSNNRGKSRREPYSRRHRPKKLSKPAATPSHVECEDSTDQGPNPRPDCRDRVAQYDGSTTITDENMNTVTEVPSAPADTTHVGAAAETDVSDAKEAESTFNEQSAQIVDEVSTTSLEQDSTVCHELFESTAGASQDVNEEEAASISPMQLGTDDCISADITEEPTEIDRAPGTGTLTNTETGETPVTISTQSEPDRSTLDGGKDTAELPNREIQLVDCTELELSQNILKGLQQHATDSSPAILPLNANEQPKEPALSHSNEAMSMHRVRVASKDTEATRDSPHQSTAEEDVIGAGTFDDPMMIDEAVIGTGTHDDPIVIAEDEHDANIETMDSDTSEDGDTERATRVRNRTKVPGMVNWTSAPYGESSVAALNDAWEEVQCTWIPLVLLDIPGLKEMESHIIDVEYYIEDHGVLYTNVGQRLCSEWKAIERRVMQSPTESERDIAQKFGKALEALQEAEAESESVAMTMGDGDVEDKDYEPSRRSSGHRGRLR